MMETVEIQVSNKKYGDKTIKTLQENHIEILNTEVDTEKDKLYIQLEKYPTNIKELLKTDWEMSEREPV